MPIAAPAPSARPNQSLPPDWVSAWDEYLVWLGFAVPGMLAKGNVDAISYALARLPAQTATLEIGSFCGLSTCVLAHLRRRHGVVGPFVTCDRWAFEGQALGAQLGGSPVITHDGYRAFVRESFLRNVRTFCGADLPSTVEVDSDGLFARWRSGETVTDVFGRAVRLGGPLGFCYIDGNHTFDYAERDFRNADEFLAPGGFLLFDDSADGSEWEVCRVVAGLLAEGRYELVAKVPNYLVRKRS